MDIVAKHSPRLTLLFEKRRASEGYLHSVFVGFEQVGQETSLGVISTMCLVDKEYTLEVGAVAVVNLHLRLVFFELLDVDHHDLQLAFIVLCDRPACNVLHQFLTALGIMHDKTTGGKFVGSLFHKVDTVNYEIELCHDVFPCKEIRQTANAVIGKSCFSAALRMPDYTAFHPII